MVEIDKSEIYCNDIIIYKTSKQTTYSQVSYFTQYSLISYSVTELLNQLDASTTNNLFQPSVRNTTY